MATANPFDLLGDDENDDPSQLIGTQQQKNAAQQQKIAAQQQKIAAQQQKIAPKKLAAAAPAKLPSRPLPPQQSARTRLEFQNVKGPQTVAFNLPNDEHIVNEHGTSMVLLKNVSEAKFINILKPIADVCIEEDQKEYIDFESFHTHTICHECCHGIGPHTIVLPSGEQSTVRMELQEVHSGPRGSKSRYCWPLGSDIPH